jgi:hypothetical protein
MEQISKVIIIFDKETSVTGTEIIPYKVANEPH